MKKVLLMLVAAACASEDMGLAEIIANFDEEKEAEEYALRNSKRKGYRTKRSPSLPSPRLGMDVETGILANNKIWKDMPKYDAPKVEKRANQLKLDRENLEKKITQL